MSLLPPTRRKLRGGRRRGSKVKRLAGKAPGSLPHRSSSHPRAAPATGPCSPSDPPLSLSPLFSQTLQPAGPGRKGRDHAGNGDDSHGPPAFPERDRPVPLAKPQAGPGPRRCSPVMLFLVASLPQTSPSLQPPSQPWCVPPTLRLTSQRPQKWGTFRLDGTSSGKGRGRSIHSPDPSLAAPSGGQGSSSPLPSRRALRGPAAESRSPTHSIPQSAFISF